VLSNADIVMLVKSIGKRVIVYREMLQADGGRGSLTIGVPGPKIS
jgi:hypothetical protein